MGLNVEQTPPRARHRREPGGGPARKLRHDDEALPRRPRSRVAASWQPNSRRSAGPPHRSCSKRPAASSKRPAAATIAAAIAGQARQSMDVRVSRRFDQAASERFADPSRAWASCSSLIREHDIKPADVVKVRVGTNRHMPNALIHHRPQNELQAKFSMEFCMAILLLRTKGRTRRVHGRGREPRPTSRHDREDRFRRAPGSRSAPATRR